MRHSSSPMERLDSWVKVNPIKWFSLCLLLPVTFGAFMFATDFCAPSAAYAAAADDDDDNDRTSSKRRGSEDDDDDKPKKSKKKDYPRWIATLYNGGQVVDVVEAEDFDYKNSSSITFETHTGRSVVIINGCIVCRRTTSDDYAALAGEIEKTQQLRKLLALKRQEARIILERTTQLDLAGEIERLTRAIQGKSKKPDDQDDDSDFTE